MRSGAAGSAPQTGRTATRVLDILELLARKPAGLTLSGVAAELAAPISSLHPLLRVLETRRYLVRGSDRRRYCLGPRLPEVSRAYLDPNEPFVNARRAMHLVAERSGETVHIAVLSGRDVEYVDGTTSRNQLSARSRVGQRLPAHLTAEGKALLAMLPVGDLASLYSGFEWPESMPGILHLHPSFDVLARDLEEVRWTGYACDDGRMERGLECVAVALPEQPGRPSTALSITVPRAQLQGDALWKLVTLLRQVAAPPAVNASATRKRPLIGWSLSFTDNLVYVEMRRAATAAMARAGGQILWTDASGKHKQAIDVRRHLEEPLDALIIHPTNAVEAAPLFVEARARKRLVVCFHRPARTREFDFFAGSDTYVRGSMQAHAVARLLNGKGGVFVAEGGSYDDNARSIGQGVRDTLAKYPGLTLLASVPCEEWHPEEAKSVVQDALSAYGPGRVNAVITANDDMAFGVADLLATEGLTQRVLLIGGDGDYHAADLIRSGAMAGTVLQDSAGMAARALQEVLRVLNGTASVADLPERSLLHMPEGPPVRALDVPYTWIDATNVGVLEDYWAQRGIATGDAMCVLAPGPCPLDGSSPSNCALCRSGSLDGSADVGRDTMKP